MNDQIKNNLLKAIRNPVAVPYIVTDFPYTEKDGEYVVDVEAGEARHEEEILNAIINNVFTQRNWTHFQDKVISISGIKEQLGREPNEDDKIIIIRGTLYKQRTEINKMVSQIWVYVIK